MKNLLFLNLLFISSLSYTSMNDKNLSYSDDDTEYTLGCFKNKNAFPKEFIYDRYSYTESMCHAISKNTRTYTNNKNLIEVKVTNSGALEYYKLPHYDKIPDNEIMLESSSFTIEFLDN